MKIEEIKIEDAIEINQLLERNGLSSLNEDSSKYRGFQDKNGKKYPIGWKLVNSDELIKGAVFSLITEYRLKNKKFLAAIISTWVIDLGFRSKNTTRLLEKFFSNNDIDFIIDGSAIKPVAKRLKDFGFNEVNESNFKNVYFWITNYSSFLQFFCLKYRIPFILLYPLYLFLSFYDALIYSKNKNKSNCNIQFLDKIPKDFSKLFEKDKKFALKKNFTSISKRIQNGLNDNKCMILAYINNDEIIGYALIDFHSYDEENIKKITIFDIYSKDNHNINDLLIREIIYFAKKNRFCFVEFYGVPNSMEKTVRINRPFSRKFDTSPFYFKVINKELLNLEEFNNWAPTIIDTDRSFY